MTTKSPAASCAQTHTKSAPDGSFCFDSVAAGSYLLIPSARRFVAISGATIDSISVEPAQTSRLVVLTLTPEATVTGKVVKADETPADGFAVTAWKLRRERGQAALRVASTSTTDKAGNYRIEDLKPGSYYLSVALPKQSKTGSRLDLFYPDSWSPDQTSSIAIGAMQTYPDINFKLHSAMTHSITGKIVGFAAFGQKPNAQLSLEPSGSINISELKRQIELNADGTFFVEGVLPGSYILRLRKSATTPGPDAKVSLYSSHQLLRQQIDVGAADLVGLELALPPDIVLTGRIVAERLDTADLASVRVTLRSIEAGGSSDFKTAEVAPDGTFRFTACDASRYLIEAAPPPGKFVSSIEFNRQAAATHLIDLSSGSGGEIVVKLGVGAAEVSGTIQSDSGSAPSGKGSH